MTYLIMHAKPACLKKKKKNLIILPYKFSFSWPYNWNLALFSILGPPLQLHRKG